MALKLNDLRDELLVACLARAETGGLSGIIDPYEVAMESGLETTPEMIGMAANIFRDHGWIAPAFSKGAVEGGAKTFFLHSSGILHAENLRDKLTPPNSAPEGRAYDGGSISPGPLDLNDGYNDTENRLLIEAVRNVDSYFDLEEAPLVNFSLVATEMGISIDHPTLLHHLDLMEKRGLVTLGGTRNDQDLFAYINSAGFERGTLLLRILELQLENSQNSIPAAGRQVSINHNAPEVIDAKHDIDKVIREIGSINDTDNIGNDILFHFSQLKAGRETLNAPYLTEEQYNALIVTPLKFIAKSAAGGVIGAVAFAATAALATALILSGVLF